MTVCVDRSVYTLTVFTTSSALHFVHEPGLVLSVLIPSFQGIFDKQ